jgi:hypothetical protein
MHQVRFFRLSFLFYSRFHQVLENEKKRSVAVQAR